MLRLIVPEIGEEEIEAVAKVLRSGYLVQGVHVAKFERLVAEYVGVKHAVAVSSGTAALHLALLALGVGPGDEIIVPDFTFPATGNVVELVGARAVLIDIDLATFNVDVNHISLAITERTKAIIPVHLFGQPAEMGPILEIAREHGLSVIEDAACALGGEYHGRRCGAMGHVGCFSFHPRKAITTGEGGMVVTDDDEVVERLRQLRNHGMVTAAGHASFELAGLNYRLTDFQGAMGVVQMGRLEGIIGRRIELAKLYCQALAGLTSIVTPSVLPGLRHIFQSYVILAEDGPLRDRLLLALSESGVEATIGTYALSAQPFYAKSVGTWPNSHRAFERALTLPLHTRMEAEDIERVALILQSVCNDD